MSAKLLVTRALVSCVSRVPRALVPHVPRPIRASRLTCYLALRASFPTHLRASRALCLTCSCTSHFPCLA